jgi:hypothetical protein
MDKKQIQRLQKRTNKYSELERVAEARVGDTPQSKLKWLLDFKDKDLTKTYRGEREGVGYELRVLPASLLTHAGKASATLQWQHGLEPLTDEVILELHEWTKALFAAMSQPWQEQRSVSIPPPTEVEIYRTSPLTAKKTRFQYIRRFSGNDERPVIKDAIVNALLEGSEYLRFCLECRKPFMAHRKKTYCNPECSQKARDRKRKPK